MVKGAPESVLARCATISPDADAIVAAQFAAGSRVVAVAARPAPEPSRRPAHRLQRRAARFSVGARHTRSRP
ncbi:MAG: hypothetical protein ACR2G2_06275 [Pseudonocardia sp.]